MFRSLLPLLLPCALALGGQTSNLKRDQEIVFYPSLCHCVNGKTWEMEIHGCVYEPDKRRTALALLRGALALEHVHLTEAQNTIFTERARLFMVAHKGGKRIIARIGGWHFAWGKAGPAGP